MSSLILLPIYLIGGHQTEQLNSFSSKSHSLYLPNKAAPGLQRVQWRQWLHEQERVPLKANNHHPFCVLIQNLSVCHTDLVAHDHSGRGHGRQFHMLLCKQNRNPMIGSHTLFHLAGMSLLMCRMNNGYYGSKATHH